MHEILAKGILSAQNGMNLYRGCTHGCIYCDSRSKCYQMDHPFEDVAVKVNAPQLLEKALKSKRAPCMISTGSMSDPYLPLERELGLTRRCLEQILRFGFGAAVLTKSADILRDADLLCQINEKSKCVVEMTLTTWDEALCKKIEPNVSTTQQRLKALAQFQKLGIPTVVWLCPILPYINDTRANLQALLDACAQVGIRGIICFGMGVTMREGNREYFYQQLDRLFPGMRAQYIRKFALQYELSSDRADMLMQLFINQCQRYGIEHRVDANFAYLREFTPRATQTTLF